MKSQLAKLTLLAVVLPFAAQARAEEEQKPPLEVRKALREGAISVAYQTLQIGPTGLPAAVHISVVPQAGLGVDEKGDPIEIKPPTTREELFRGRQGSSPGFNITPSPFYLDVFAPLSNRPGARLYRVNSARFTDNRNVTSIALSYLKPKTRQGPMLIVGYSAFRSFSARVFTFPKGLRRRVVASDFSKESYGGTNYGTSFDLSKPDRRGLVALEESGYSPTGTDWVVRHVWNGRRFEKQPKHFTPKPYLVIAALSKNRTEVEALRKKLGDAADALGTSEVLPTSRFRRLPPHSYVLVLVRCPTLEAANERVAWWNQAAYLRKDNPAAQKLKLSIKRGN